MEEFYSPSLDLCIEFVNEWYKLIDESTSTSNGFRGPAVDFLVDGSVETIPKAWHDYFLHLVDLDSVLTEMNQHLSCSDVNAPKSLCEFLARAQSCCSPLPVVAGIERFALKDTRGVKQKKVEEIEIFASFIADLCRKADCKRVIDIG